MKSALKNTLDRIARATLRAQRDPSGVRLMAATKQQSAAVVQEYINCCAGFGIQALIGENYVQEWELKRAQIKGSYQSALIGPLQSNKAKKGVELFDSIHTVDSEKLASKLNSAAAGIAQRDVFIQVNISSDQAKHGVPVAEFERLARFILSSCSNLKLAGLMTITKFYEYPEQARPDYRAMSLLRNELSASLGLDLELSMGMSGDFEVAIEEGASIVRVGTAIFGARG